MDYEHLSQAERDDVVAEALIERENEHYHYELNRRNYEHILDSLKDVPEVWPAHLDRYKTLVGEALAKAVTGADYSLACRLQYRDRIRLLLATTIVERDKVETVHRALKASLPDKDRQAAAVSRVRAKRNK